MIVNFSPNDGCAIVYCISRISLLDTKSIFFFFFFLKSPLFQFEVAFSDIWIFLRPNGGGGRHLFFVENSIIVDI